jgi:hypothetical protein
MLSSDESKNIFLKTFEKIIYSFFILMSDNIHESLNIFLLRNKYLNKLKIIISNEFSSILN